MRFLVFGSTGMAGHVVSLYLAEQGHEVHGTARRDAQFLLDRGVRVISLDATNPDAVYRILAQGDYDVAINCVGLLNKACDDRPDLAVYLNSCFPHLLEVATRGTRTRIFHLSTDCVFAGNTGPYSEDSIPDGMTFYDKTKALGEIRNEKDLTLRQSIVGPDVDPEGIGLLNWFMKQEGEVRGFTGAIWTGLTTLELAKAIERCAESSSVGLVNMVPSACISKYNLLGLFNRELRAKPLEIVPDDALKLDKTLLRGNSVCSFIPNDYAGQIADLANWMHSHEELYPHYLSLRK